MRDYIAYYKGKELQVIADSSYQAQKQAIKVFNPPRSKNHMVHVVLADTPINTGGLG